MSDANGLLFDRGENERYDEEAHRFTCCAFPIFVRWIFEDVMTCLGRNREGPQISRVTPIQSGEVLDLRQNRTLVWRGIRSHVSFMSVRPDVRTRSLKKRPV